MRFLFNKQFNKQYFVIYLIIIVSFTVFYITMFYINRVTYLENTIKDNEIRISSNINSKSDTYEFMNKYHFKNFVAYCDLIKHLYSSGSLSLESLLKNQYVYDFVGIVKPDNTYEFLSNDRFKNTFNIKDIVNLDSVSGFLYFDPNTDKSYHVFVSPIYKNGRIEAHLVAYLDILYYGSDNFYIVSKKGKILNELFVNGIDMIGKNISSIFPEEWSKISSNSSGQFVSKYGLFTYNTLYGLKSIGNTKIDQKDYYIISIQHIDINDSPYFVKNLKSFMKYVDFKVNIVYWLIGYFWIFITSILSYALIVDRLRQGELARYDELTGVLNRRGGYRAIEKLIKEYNSVGLKRFVYTIIARVISFRRVVHSLHFCMIDVNGLKGVNDNLGHKYGDELITSVSFCLKRNLNKGELLLRLGGDEFVVLFVNRDTNSIESYWEETKQLFKYRGEVSGKYAISVSYGVIEYDNSMTMIECIKVADELMYQDKKRQKINLFFN